MKLIAASIIVAVIPVVAQAEVIVTKPWARASVLASRPGAAYMTVVSDTDDRLVMLMNLSAKLQEGEKFQMTLFFETAGEVTVEVPVRGPGAINSQDDTP